MTSYGHLPVSERSKVMAALAAAGPRKRIGQGSKVRRGLSGSYFVSILAWRVNRFRRRGNLVLYRRTDCVASSRALRCFPTGGRAWTSTHSFSVGRPARAARSASTTRCSRPDCATSSPSSTSRPRARLTAVRTELSATALAAVRPPGVTFVDVFGQLCADRGCPVFMPAGDIISYDGSQLTPAGAACVGQRLSSADPLPDYSP